jgi:molecular chaperone HtpG
MTTSTVKETLGFQAEVKQLLHLMIHSLYSNREIFLRELVSNASDACDKLRFAAMDDASLQSAATDFAIDLSLDKDARTITLSDNGIGMSRDEVVANLGTIARSGTKEFFTKLSGDRAKDSNLIGQFGVGFYSAFIVAKHVVVETRRAGTVESAGVRWASEGAGEFSIEAINRPTHGTTITLHLRDDDEDNGERYSDLLNRWQIENIVKKYSDHISLPIRMRRERWDAEQQKMLLTDEMETINAASALWTRSKSDITPEQYENFFSGLAAPSGMMSAGNTEPALAYTHNRVEGRSEYIQLLGIPAKAGHDLYDRQQRKGIKLYVRRVFIMDDAEQLLPAYLRFVRGVIDSADLPLNVSREILQQSRDVKVIREGSTKRILGMLEDLAENKAEGYEKFWAEYGQVLKEGLGEDFGNQERIAKLLRFASTTTKGEGQTVSLATYLARMKPEQEKIYYVTADTVDAARNSPHLEVFAKKGVEVLLLTDRVDEWMMSFLNEFEGKGFESVAKGAIDLGKLQDEQEKQAQSDAQEKHKDLTVKMAAALGDKVKEVRVSGRLTESASCLVSEEGDISGHLERLLKQAGQQAPARKPVLEINPEHPIVVKMQASAQFDEFAHLLFEQALLAEGGQLTDPASFVKRVNRLLA